jgi:uncharacterized protein (TIGR03067 family)
VKFNALAAVLFSLVSSSVALCDDASSDIKKLEGTWMPTSAELAGGNSPIDLKTMKLVIKDDTYSVTVGNQSDKGTLKIDSKAKIKTMDITSTDGPNKGKTILSIYELDGDTLKICYDLRGKNRPTEFKTKADTFLFLVTYKRQ